MAAKRVARTIPCISISSAVAKPTAHASATSRMRGARDSRARGVICLESRAPLKVEARSVGSPGRITAPTETGPASAPRPASSNAAMYFSPLFQSSDSKKVVGSIRIVIVYTAPCIDMNTKNIPDHVYCIAQRADFAVCKMIPVNGYLLNLVTTAARDVEQFDIE